MHKRTGIVAMLLVLAAGTARAQDRGFGLGIIVGEPTGLSGKSWLSRTTAFDFAAAWSFSHDGALHLHGDFLVHRFDLLHIDPGKLPIYYGLGGRIKFSDNNSDNNDDVTVGLRIPVGLDYLFDHDPLDIFLEIVPLLDLAPDTDFELNASLGIRYWFK